MAYKLKNIRERVGKIVKLKSDLSLTEGVNDRQVIRKKRKLTHSFVDAATVIGRDGDKENIIDHLLNPDVENISILPIVGLGGLGKTTLAKLVYNDQRVQKHFEIKVWTCIFDDCDLQEVLRTIIQAATSQECKGWDIEKLQAFLRETVNNKKYLLVLDDVWNEDRRKWNELRALLMGGAKGSWIIVTTRKNSVVSLMANVPPYNLNELCYKNCLSLFLKCAFKNGQDVKHYPNLVRIGEEIVRKCKGLPLAVETLGNLLYSVTSEREWKSVRDKEIWKLEQKEDDIMSALTISYEQLPSYLKRCFAYCSFFPKDHTYSDFRLIYFWMAHGLLQSKNEHEELEDVGLRYFKELCSRSFFQDFDQWIGLVCCKRMADLMHDLALSLTQKECSIVTSATQQIPGNVRHLLFADLNSLRETVPMSLHGLDSVRTIAPFVDSDNISQSFLPTYLPRFQFLRYLDLRHSEIEILPEGVGVLKHLRFLSLSVSKIRRLPNSISKLQSLQTLWLKSCDGIEELPSDMRSFISLRSLSITTKQKWLPNNGIGCLKSLRCLEIASCRNIEYLFEDMQGLTSLRKLSIVNCSSLISLLQSIKYLTALEILFINNCENLDLEIEEGSNNQRDFAQFCRLEKLMLGYLPKLVEFPQWLLNSYSNTLQFCRLVNCCNLNEWPACPTCVQELEIDHCGRFTKSDDWSSIAHVPKVLINGVQLQPTAGNCGTSDPNVVVDLKL